MRLRGFSATLAIAVAAVLAAIGGLGLTAWSGTTQATETGGHAESEAGPESRRDAQRAMNSVQAPAPATGSRGATDPQESSNTEEWHLTVRLRFNPDVENDLLTLERIFDEVRAAPVNAGEEPDDDLSVAFDSKESQASTNVMAVRSDAIPVEHLPGFRNAARISVVVSLDLRCGKTVSIERSVVARNHGTTLDLGEIEFSLAEGLDDDVWIVAGCLQDSQRQPLHNTCHAWVVLDTDDSVAAEIATDPAGRFAEAISLGWVLRRSRKGSSADTEELIRALEWVFDPGYFDQHHRLPLPRPAVNLADRVLDFGTVSLPAASLEIDCHVPAGVDPGPSPPECAHVTVVSINDEMRLQVQVGYPARIVLAPGTHRIRAEYREDSDQVGRDLVSSTHGALNVQRHQVTLLDGASERIRVPWHPPHEVAVTVERRNESEAGVLEIEYCPDASGGHSTDNRPILGSPVIVRMLPGERAIARARLAGYAEVEAEVPVDSNTLVLRPVGRSESACIVVEFCPDPPWMLPAGVWIQGPGEQPIHRGITFNSDRPDVEARNVPPGRYKLVWRTAPWKVPPYGDLHEPVEFELAAGETRRFRVEKFIEPTATGWRVRCRSTILDGFVPGEWADFPKISWPRVAIGDQLLCVRDGAAIHTWKQVKTEEGVISEIELPARIEVRFGNGLGEARGKPFAPRVNVSAEFDDGRVRCESESNGVSAWLWAPPGHASIRVSERSYSRSSPTFDWQTTIEVRAGEVVVVNVPADLGRVDFGRAATHRPQVRDAIQPVWGLWNDEGRFLHWITRQFEFLEAGSYLARPALGPDSKHEIRFDVAASSDIEVHLHGLSSIPTTGTVRLPRMKWMMDGCSVWVSCTPVAWGDQIKWWWPSHLNERARLGADYLEISGLPAGIELQVSLDYIGGERGGSCDFTVHCTGAVPTVVNAVQWEED